MTGPSVFPEALSTRARRQARAFGASSLNLMARTRDLQLTLLVRGFGGMAGVLPPMVAILAVDRTKYGLASANFALALLLTGPINQYVQQGYLRDLIVFRAQGAGRRPPGTAAIYLFCAIALMCLGLAGACGLPWEDAALTGVLTLFAVGMRVQESHFTVGDRQKTAVTLFYIMPPVILCLGMLVLRRLLPFGDFAVVSIAQLFAYGLPVALSCLSPAAPLSDLLPPPLPRGRAAWSREIGPVWIFFGTGVLMGGAEQAPTLLLRSFGMPSAIPAFEIARKAASVPALVGHACSMQLAPKLVSSAENRIWPVFESVMETYCIILSSISLAYIGALVLLAFLVGPHLEIMRSLDYGVVAVLLGSALIITVTVPFGSAIVALRGENWLLFGPGASFALQLAVSFALFPWLGPLAIAIAVAAQNAVLGAVVIVGTLVILRRRRAASP